MDLIFTCSKKHFGLTSVVRGALEQRGPAGVILGVDLLASYLSLASHHIHHHHTLILIRGVPWQRLIPIRTIVTTSSHNACEKSDDIPKDNDI